MTLAGAALAWPRPAAALALHGLVENTVVAVPPQGGLQRGLRHQGAYGTADDLAKKVVEHPVGVPDF